MMIHGLLAFVLVLKPGKKARFSAAYSCAARHCLTLANWGFFYTYDILFAKNYNPNERTAFVFSTDNPKVVVGEQLRRAILSYYNFIRPKEMPN